MTKRSKVILIILISCSVKGLTVVFPPIPQHPGNHNFADMRVLINIPNFGDVMSNLFLLNFGLVGMIAVFISRKENSVFTMKREIIPWVLFCWHIHGWLWLWCTSSNPFGQTAT